MYVSTSSSGNFTTTTATRNVTKYESATGINYSFGDIIPNGRTLKLGTTAQP
jgi:hypothetical protein